MAKGESEMSWYAEVILSYIIIEKQSDMERRHGSPHIVTSHSFFFFSLTTSQSSLSPSPVRSFGERVMVMAGEKKKKKKKKKYQAARLFVQKNACGWYVASKGPSVTPFKWIHCCSGGEKKRTSGNNESLLGYEVDLKRGSFLFSPTQLLRQVKTVN